MNLSMLLGLIGLLLLLGSLHLAWRGLHQAGSERVLERLTEGHDRTVVEQSLGWLERLFLRAGFRLPRQRFGRWLGGWLAGVILGLLLGGWFGLVVMLVLPLLALRLYMAWLYQRRVQRMIEQLPLFLDHVIRSLKSGRALGDGLLLAMEAVPDPLKEAFGRSRRNVQRGMGLGEALEEFATLYERDEFQILALGMQVNQRYGGNSSELLGNLITLIREREQGFRRLRAMTGETRISAMVMGGLPLALAGYIFFTNPQFIIGMWEDPSGRVVLLIAFVLQALGSFALWRMLRSI